MIKEPISLSIFFPTYNEEDNIGGSIEKAVAVAEHSPFVGDYEVIVVNDGSHDQTAAVVERYAAANPHVRLVNHTVNRGVGTAIVTGFAAATKEYVFYTDADLQFDIAEINSLLLHLDTADAVIGYRAPRRDPFMRLVNAKGWNVLNRLFFGLKVRDIDCAFKVFRTSDIQKISLRSGGAMTIAESLIRLNRANITFKEVPVSHYPRTAGSPTGAKLSVIVRALAEMMHLYRTDLGSLTQKQALKFMGVGVINTTVDFILYFTLTRGGFVTSIALAKLFAFLGGTVTSFYLNRAWTFAMQSKPSWREGLRFLGVVSASLVANVLVMSVFTSVFHIYDLVALLMSTVFTFAISFSFTRTWVFVKRAKQAAIIGAATAGV